jgi:NAD(P)H-flavin reductase
VSRIEVAVAEPWRHRPGQVAELSLAPGEDGFFAIASAPHEAPRLTFLVRAGGSISPQLMALGPGDGLSLGGPYGRGYELAAETLSGRPTPPPLLLVGVGTALGALRSALVDALETLPTRQITLLLGIRRPEELCFADEIQSWRQRGVAIHIVASRGGPEWTGLVGHVQDHMPAVVDAVSRGGSPLCLIAGSEVFEDELTERLVAAGVPNASIQRNFRPDARDLAA